MISRRSMMGTTLARMGATLASSAWLVSCSQSEQPSESMPTETAAAAPPPAEPPRYDPEDLKKQLDAGEDVFLLDVRRPDELEENGAIEGYHHIPMDQIEARMSEIPRDRPLVVY
jgi:hypothetical protein